MNWNVVRTDVFIFTSEFDEEVIQLACVVSFKHPVGCLVLRKDWTVVSLKLVPVDLCQDQYGFIKHIIEKMGPGKIDNTYLCRLKRQDLRSVYQYYVVIKFLLLKNMFLKYI